MEAVSTGASCGCSAAAAAAPPHSRGAGSTSDDSLVPQAIKVSARLQARVQLATGEMRCTSDMVSARAVPRNNQMPLAGRRRSSVNKDERQSSHEHMRHAAPREQGNDDMLAPLLTCTSHQGMVPRRSQHGRSSQTVVFGPGNGHGQVWQALHGPYRALS